MADVGKKKSETLETSVSLTQNGDSFSTRPGAGVLGSLFPIEAAFLVTEDNDALGIDLDLDVAAAPTHGCRQPGPKQFRHRRSQRQFDYRGVDSHDATTPLARSQIHVILWLHSVVET